MFHKIKSSHPTCVRKNEEISLKRTCRIFINVDELHIENNKHIILNVADENASELEVHMRI